MAMQQHLPNAAARATTVPPESQQGQLVLTRVSMSYLDKNYTSYWKVSEISLIQNAALRQAYNERKEQMIRSYNSPVEEQLMFLCLENDNLTQHIIDNGAECRPNSSFNIIGDSAQGIYVCCHADIQLRVAEGFDKDECKLIIYKICSGKKVKQRPLVRHSGVPPTPGADCHICSEEASLSDDLHIQVVKSQVYLYELVNNQPVRRPRQCFPLAVITFKKSTQLQRIISQDSMMPWQQQANVVRQNQNNTQSLLRRGAGQIQQRDSSNPVQNYGSVQGSVPSANSGLQRQVNTSFLQQALGAAVQQNPTPYIDISPITSSSRGYIDISPTPNLSQNNPSLPYQYQTSSSSSNQHTPVYQCGCPPYGRYGRQHLDNCPNRTLSSGENLLGSNPPYVQHRTAAATSGNLSLGGTSGGLNTWQPEYVTLPETSFPMSSPQILSSSSRSTTSSGTLTTGPTATSCVTNVSYPTQTMRSNVSQSLRSPLVRSVLMQSLQNEQNSGNTTFLTDRVSQDSTNLPATSQQQQSESPMKDSSFFSKEFLARIKTEKAGGYSDEVNTQTSAASAPLPSPALSSLLTSGEIRQPVVTPPAINVPVYNPVTTQTVTRPILNVPTITPSQLSQAKHNAQSLSDRIRRAIRSAQSETLTPSAAITTNTVVTLQSQSTNVLPLNSTTAVTSSQKSPKSSLLNNVISRLTASAGAKSPTANSGSTVPTSRNPSLTPLSTAVTIRRGLSTPPLSQNPPPTNNNTLVSLLRPSMQDCANETNQESETQLQSQNLLPTNNNLLTQLLEQPVQSSEKETNLESTQDNSDNTISSQTHIAPLLSTMIDGGLNQPVAQESQKEGHRDIELETRQKKSTTSPKVPDSGAVTGAKVSIVKRGLKVPDISRLSVEGNSEDDTLPDIEPPTPATTSSEKESQKENSSESTTRGPSPMIVSQTYNHEVVSDIGLGSELSIPDNVVPDFRNSGPVMHGSSSPMQTTDSFIEQEASVNSRSDLLEGALSITREDDSEIQMSEKDSLSHNTGLTDNMNRCTITGESVTTETPNLNQHLSSKRDDIVADSFGSGSKVEPLNGGNGALFNILSDGTIQVVIEEFIDSDDSDGSVPPPSPGIGHLINNIPPKKKSHSKKKKSKKKERHLLPTIEESQNVMEESVDHTDSAPETLLSKISNVVKKSPEIKPKRNKKKYFGMSKKKKKKKKEVSPLHIKIPKPKIVKPKPTVPKPKIKTKRPDEATMLICSAIEAFDVGKVNWEESGNGDNAKNDTADIPDEVLAIANMYSSQKRRTRSASGPTKSVDKKEEILRTQQEAAISIERKEKNEPEAAKSTLPSISESDTAEKNDNVENVDIETKSTENSISDTSKDMDVSSSSNVSSKVNTSEASKEATPDKENCDSFVKCFQDIIDKPGGFIPHRESPIPGLGDTLLSTGLMFDDDDDDNGNDDGNMFDALSSLEPSISEEMATESSTLVHESKEDKEKGADIEKGSFSPEVEKDSSDMNKSLHDLIGDISAKLDEEDVGSSTDANVLEEKAKPTTKKSRRRGGSPKGKKGKAKAQLRQSPVKNTDNQEKDLAGMDANVKDTEATKKTETEVVGTDDVPKKSLRSRKKLNDSLNESDVTEDEEGTRSQTRRRSSERQTSPARATRSRTKILKDESDKEKEEMTVEADTEDPKSESEADKRDSETPKKTSPKINKTKPLSVCIKKLKDEEINLIAGRNISPVRDLAAKYKELSSSEEEDNLVDQDEGEKECTASVPAPIEETLSLIRDPRIRKKLTEQLSTNIKVSALSQKEESKSKVQTPEAGVVKPKPKLRGPKSARFRRIRQDSSSDTGVSGDDGEEKKKKKIIPKPRVPLPPLPLAPAGKNKLPGVHKLGAFRIPKKVNRGDDSDEQVGKSPTIEGPPSFRSPTQSLSIVSPIDRDQRGPSTPSFTNQRSRGQPITGLQSKQPKYGPVPDSKQVPSDSEAREPVKESTQNKENEEDLDTIQSPDNPYEDELDQDKSELLSKIDLSDMGDLMDLRSQLINNLAECGSETSSIQTNDTAEEGEVSQDDDQDIDTRNVVLRTEYSADKQTDRSKSHQDFFTDSQAFKAMMDRKKDPSQEARGLNEMIPTEWMSQIKELSKEKEKTGFSDEQMNVVKNILEGLSGGTGSQVGPREFWNENKARDVQRKESNERSDDRQRPEDRSRENDWNKKDRDRETDRRKDWNRDRDWAHNRERDRRRDDEWSRDREMGRDGRSDGSKEREWSRDRDRERDRDTSRDKGWNRDYESPRDRERNRELSKDRERERERDYRWEREADRSRERDRHQESERSRTSHRERESDKEWNRERPSHRDGDRDRNREHRSRYEEKSRHEENRPSNTSWGFYRRREIEEEEHGWQSSSRSSFGQEDDFERSRAERKFDEEQSRPREHDYRKENEAEDQATKVWTPDSIGDKLREFKEQSSQQQEFDRVPSPFQNANVSNEPAKHWSPRDSMPRRNDSPRDSMSRRNDSPRERSQNRSPRCEEADGAPYIRHGESERRELENIPRRGSYTSQDRHGRSYDRTDSHQSRYGQDERRGHFDRGPRSSNEHDMHIMRGSHSPRQGGSGRDSHFQRGTKDRDFRSGRHVSPDRQSMDSDSSHSSHRQRRFDSPREPDIQSPPHVSPRQAAGVSPRATTTHSQPQEQLVNVERKQDVDMRIQRTESLDSTHSRENLEHGLPSQQNLKPKETFPPPKAPQLGHKLKAIGNQTNQIFKTDSQLSQDLRHFQSKLAKIHKALDFEREKWRKIQSLMAKDGQEFYVQDMEICESRLSIIQLDKEMTETCVRKVREKIRCEANHLLPEDVCLFEEKGKFVSNEGYPLVLIQPLPKVIHDELIVLRIDIEATRNELKRTSSMEALKCQELRANLKFLHEQRKDKLLQFCGCPKGSQQVYIDDFINQLSYYRSLELDLQKPEHTGRREYVQKRIAALEFHLEFVRKLQECKSDIETLNKSLAGLVNPHPTKPSLTSSTADPVKLPSGQQKPYTAPTAAVKPNVHSSTAPNPSTIPKTVPVSKVNPLSKTDSEQIRKTDPIKKAEVAPMTKKTLKVDHTVQSTKPQRRLSTEKVLPVETIPQRKQSTENKILPFEASIDLTEETEVIDIDSESDSPLVIEIDSGREDTADEKQKDDVPSKEGQTSVKPTETVSLDSEKRQRKDSVEGKNDSNNKKTNVSHKGSNAEKKSVDRRASVEGKSDSHKKATDRRSSLESKRDKKQDVTKQPIEDKKDEGGSTKKNTSDRRPSVESKKEKKSGERSSKDSEKVRRKESTESTKDKKQESSKSEKAGNKEEIGTSSKKTVPVKKKPTVQEFNMFEEISDEMTVPAKVKRRESTHKDKKRISLEGPQGSDKAPEKEKKSEDIVNVSTSDSVSSKSVSTDQKSKQHSAKPGHLNDHERKKHSTDKDKKQSKSDSSEKEDGEVTKEAKKISKSESSQSQHLHAKKPHSVGAKDKQENRKDPKTDKDKTQHTEAKTQQHKRSQSIDGASSKDEIATSGERKNVKNDTKSKESSAHKVTGDKKVTSKNTSESEPTVLPSKSQSKGQEKQRKDSTEKRLVEKKRPIDSTSEFQTETKKLKTDHKLSAKGMSQTADGYKRQLSEKNTQKENEGETSKASEERSSKKSNALDKSNSTSKISLSKVSQGTSEQKLTKTDKIKKNVRNENNGAKNTAQNITSEDNVTKKQEGKNKVEGDTSQATVSLQNKKQTEKESSEPKKVNIYKPPPMKIPRLSDKKIQSNKQNSESLQLSRKDSPNIEKEEASKEKKGSDRKAIDSERFKKSSNERDRSSASERERKRPYHESEKRKSDRSQERSRNEKERMKSRYDKDGRRIRDEYKSRAEKEGYRYSSESERSKYSSSTEKYSSSTERERERKWPRVDKEGKSVKELISKSVDSSKMEKNDKVLASDGDHEKGAKDNVVSSGKMTESATMLRAGEGTDKETNITSGEQINKLSHATSDIPHDVGKKDSDIPVEKHDERITAVTAKISMSSSEKETEVNTPVKTLVEKAEEVVKETVTPGEKSIEKLTKETNVEHINPEDQAQPVISKESSFHNDNLSGTDEPMEFVVIDSLDKSGGEENITETSSDPNKNSDKSTGNESFEAKDEEKAETSSKVSDGDPKGGGDRPNDDKRDSKFNKLKKKPRNRKRAELWRRNQYESRRDFDNYGYDERYAGYDERRPPDLMDRPAGDNWDQRFDNREEEFMHQREQEIMYRREQEFNNRREEEFMARREEEFMRGREEEFMHGREEEFMHGREEEFMNQGPRHHDSMDREFDHFEHRQNYQGSMGRQGWWNNNRPERELDMFNQQWSEARQRIFEQQGSNMQKNRQQGKNHGSNQQGWNQGNNQQGRNCGNNQPNWNQGNNQQGWNCGNNQQGWNPDNNQGNRQQGWNRDTNQQGWNQGNNMQDMGQQHW